jgi:hypothetical protein
MGTYAVARDTDVVTLFNSPQAVRRFIFFTAGGGGIQSLPTGIAAGGTGEVTLVAYESRRRGGGRVAAIVAFASPVMLKSAITASIGKPEQILVSTRPTSEDFCLVLVPLAGITDLRSAAGGTLAIRYVDSNQVLRDVPHASGQPSSGCDYGN